MNIKITKEQHDRLCQTKFTEHPFGSRLFGTHRPDSDYDFIRVYKYSNVFGDKNYYLPNIHSFQYDESDNNTQYIWMTLEQFYGGLWSGDGTMQADIFMFGDYHKDVPLKEKVEVVRTYKIIRAYLGVAKRDLKLHNTKNKLFHANRSLYIAESLIGNNLPELNVIQSLCDNLANKETVLEKVEIARKMLNSMYEKREIENYYVPLTKDDLLNVLLSSNNTREFKYD